jgi:hypothetical protein
MTEEERREMMRSNYAAQMEMLGYDASGNPLDDVVRVVRCRDCKWWEEGQTTDGVKGFCPISGCCEGPEFYCADGERRDSE